MPETAALPLPDYTLGIVHGDAADEACLCLLDHRARARAGSSVRTRGVPLRQQAIERGRCDAIDNEGLDAIERLLADAVPPGASFGVLAEADRVLYDEAVRAPMGIFPWSDPVVATLIALAMHPLGVRVVFAFYEVPERAALVLHHMPDAPRAVHVRQPRFLGRGLLGALTEQWLDAVPSSRRRAAAAASVARTPGLYAYWTCRGAAPSLGDVALYLRRGWQKMLVGSSDADFSMRVRPPVAQLDEIALDYAECRDRHAAALGENDAHRIALVELCRRHRFDLRTIARHRPDVDAIDPRRVWPWPDDDRWVAEALTASE